MSGDGHYVVFSTRATNFFADDDPDPPSGSRQGGVFRHRQGSADAPGLVADGDVVDDSGATVLTGASNPSTSADGRYDWLLPGDGDDAKPYQERDVSRAIDALSRERGS